MLSLGTRSRVTYLELYSLTSRSIVTSEIHSLMDRSRGSWYFVNVEVLGFKTADMNWFAECGFKKQGQPEL